MRKTMVIVMVLMLITIVLVAGCGEEDEYVGVCVDPKTEVRVDDDYCDKGDDDYVPGMVVWWMLAGSGHHYPAVGQRANRKHFQTKAPSSAKTKFGGLSTKGGTVKPPTKGGGGSNNGGSKPKAPAPAPKPPAPKPR